MFAARERETSKLCKIGFYLFSNTALKRNGLTGMILDSSDIHMYCSLTTFEFIS